MKRSMGVPAIFLVIFIIAATVEAEDGSIIFWRKEVTLTCPKSGDWYHFGTQLQDSAQTYTVEYERQLSVHCVYDQYAEGEPVKYYFYAKGKVCENCFELDALVLGGVVIADFVLTTVLMVVIYKYSKKKNLKFSFQSARASQGLSRARAAPAAEGEYQELAHGSRETYTAVSRRK